jgi:protein arginine N-methyltransferase 1
MKADSPDPLKGNGPSATDIDWHRDMLSDRKRVRAFRDVISRAVHPGDVVVDVGTGTGLLALLAAKAGASKVYAIEQEGIIHIARRMAADNGFSDRIVFFRGHSTEIELPEKADLLVGELIGSFGLEEEILEVLSDARRRFLKPGGRLVPDGLDLILAPSEEGAQYTTWHLDLEAEFGLDFSGMADLAQHRSFGSWADENMLLASPTTVFSVDLADGPQGPIESEAETTILRDGLLAGWVGWFEARHNGRSFIDTRPPIPGSSWENVIFPIGEPIAVRSGDSAKFKLRLDQPFWSWEFQLNDQPARVFTEFNCETPLLVPVTASGVSAP